MAISIYLFLDEGLSVKQIIKAKRVIEIVLKDPDRASPVHELWDGIIPKPNLSITPRFKSIKTKSMILCRGSTAPSNIGTILEAMPTMIIVINPNPHTCTTGAANSIETAIL
jgi:hypothetical protein|tara:strand:- start:646 stop:981 length:336 start_codon:yes stop_codon:yes gene_type:complete